MGAEELLIELTDRQRRLEIQDLGVDPSQLAQGSEIENLHAHQQLLWVRGILPARRSPIVWLLLAACNEFNLDSIDPEGPPPVVVIQVERFVQQPSPTVDVLFVVDGTASMELELDALGASVDSLIDTLDSLRLDWQLGVVSASGTGPWAGWLLGSPYILTPLTPDPAEAFAARLPRDAIEGEAGLAAATFALEQATASGANAGFLREGARLQVVFVSDADDHSDLLLVDPEQDFLDQLEASAGAHGTASALVGDPPSGCTSANGSAQAGVRYFNVVRETGGQLGSICSIGFADLLQDLGSESYVLPSVFTLRVSAGIESVTVTIDGEPTLDWTRTGDQLTFDLPPPAGSIIEVFYVVREEA